VPCGQTRPLETSQFARRHARQPIRPHSKRQLGWCIACFHRVFALLITCGECCVGFGFPRPKHTCHSPPPCWRGRTRTREPTGACHLDQGGECVLTGEDRLGQAGAGLQTGEDRLGQAGAGLQTGEDRLGQAGANLQTQGSRQHRRGPLQSCGFGSLPRTRPGDRGRCRLSWMNRRTALYSLLFTP